MKKDRSLAERIIEFNCNLRFEGKLPPGFAVLNPYLTNPETLVVMKQFYHKFYNDHKPRKFIIGINPSRYGAGITGVPFTDTKRLLSYCGINMSSAHTHEVSSVFMYDMINSYGGVNKFYHNFYINSPFPLAIVRLVKNDHWLNANYYDDIDLFSCVKHFMIETLQKHIELGLITSEVYVLGKKNYTFLKQINKEKPMFKKMLVLDHPRFIQQYKSKEKQKYIDNYIITLSGIGNMHD